jgi:hypothetical protein
VLGDGVDGALGDVLVVGNVQGQQRRAVLDEGNEARVGQAAAVGQRQALDPGADGEGHDASIVDLVGEGGEVEALDEVAVLEVGVLEAERLADAVVVLPVGAGRPVPQQVDSVPSPALGHEHAVV